MKEGQGEGWFDLLSLGSCVFVIGFVFRMVIVFIWHEVILVFVDAVLAVQSVHFIDVNKNQNDKAENRPLLRHPEPEAEAHKPEVVQRVGE